MSYENLSDFLRQSQLRSAAVIQQTCGGEGVGRLVVKLGAEQGFVFTEADVHQFLESAEQATAAELSDEQLAEVAAGALSITIQVSEPKTMQELYQDWANLGRILKTASGR